jgi:hypothetical protein
MIITNDKKSIIDLIEKYMKKNLDIGSLYLEIATNKIFIV